MPTIVITPSQDGGLEGASWQDKRHYERWKARVRELKPGDTLEFTWKSPRSPEFHRRHFAILNRVFENQEVFEGEYEFRKWAELGANHCTWVPGPNGRPQAIPKSIEYASLDDDEFRELHAAVKAFLRTTHALKTLWPHVSPDKSWEALDHMLEGQR
ncbi:MAG TPA: hypothetical protein VFH49_08685 [Aquabacterium sp.]|nr:hypothetical protein [Aquabacterium sp.]